MQGESSEYNIKAAAEQVLAYEKKFPIIVRSILLSIVEAES